MEEWVPRETPVWPGLSESPLGFLWWGPQGGVLETVSAPQTPPGSGGRAAGHALTAPCPRRARGSCLLPCGDSESRNRPGVAQGASGLVPSWSSACAARPSRVPGEGDARGQPGW